MAKKTQTVQDAEIVIVREKGINVKGFGHVAKRVMSDNTVSVSAKGIYGYLSSMAGSGESSFMRRSRLLSELNIGKRAYDANMKMLEDRGYITRAQARAATGFFSTTVIEFVMIPSHLADEIFKAQQAEMRPTMYSGTVYALGYGSIPRLVMQDPSLSVKAKGLYAYFCAYAGPESDSFPSRDKICFELCINKESYNKYKNELIVAKYISAYQNYQNGKFAGNTFRINQFPNQVEVDSTKAIVVTPQSNHSNCQCTENSTTANQCTKNGTTEDPCTENRCTVDQCTENQCTVDQCTENGTTHIINNNIPTNNSMGTTTKPSTKNNILLDRLIAMVREKIHYEILMFSYANELSGIQAIDTLVNAVVETLSSTSPRISIGRDYFFTKDVQNTLLNINNEVVVNVVERYLAHMEKVDNPQAYLLASIYNEIVNPTVVDEEAF